jgi:hypothetical protein
MCMLHSDDWTAIYICIYVYIHINTSLPRILYLTAYIMLFYLVFLTFYKLQITHFRQSVFFMLLSVFELVKNEIQTWNAVVKCTLSCILAVGGDGGWLFYAETCRLFLAVYNVVLTDCTINFHLIMQWKCATLKTVCMPKIFCYWL